MIKIIYLANIVVAGWIGASSLFFPRYSIATVFSGVYSSTEVVRLVGALWLSIAFVSCLGVWRPVAFSPVLLIQLIYKTTWLLAVALPAVRHGRPFPGAMALFFIVWVVVLPFVLPWRYYHQLI